MGLLCSPTVFLDNLLTQTFQTFLITYQRDFLSGLIGAPTTNSTPTRVEKLLVLFLTHPRYFQCLFLGLLVRGCLTLMNLTCGALYSV